MDFFWTDFLLFGQINIYNYILSVELCQRKMIKIIRWDEQISVAKNQ